MSYLIDGHLNTSMVSDLASNFLWCEGHPWAKCIPRESDTLSDREKKRVQLKLLLEVCLSELIHTENILEIIVSPGMAFAC